jgi:hypothetical protein
VVSSVQDFPIKVVYEFTIILMRVTCAAHIILLNLFTVIISGEEYIIQYLLFNFLILHVLLLSLRCKIDEVWNGGYCITRNSVVCTRKDHLVLLG